MSQATAAPPRFRTVADLLRQLGDIPPDRVRLRPSPGEATEDNLLQPDGRLCELVGGVLVEKAMGFVESMLAMELIVALGTFLKNHRLGILTGEGGPIRLMTGLVRVPDIAFFSWERLPGRKAPREAVLQVAPDLVVEVISQGNTQGEMERKAREYFEAGTRLAWLIDPRNRTIRVFTSPESMTKLGEADTLDGGDVLPGFRLSMADLFECLDRVQEG